MSGYRITKYNPANRNEQGHYVDDLEWTSISDIGKAEYSYVTYEQYEKVESAYVAAIKAIMKDNDLHFLTVDSLESQNIKQNFDEEKKMGRLENFNIDYDKDVRILKNGLRLNVEQIEKMIRLILRETTWMLLVADNFELRFGHDYYMYVMCRQLNKATIKEIEDSGLFVEAL